MSDLDITVLILSEHEAFRRSFAEIAGLTDPADLGRRWQELADQLEVHAAGEEELFYPELLHEVVDSEDDTKLAVKDHNEIRDATRAVATHEVGSDPWWEAFRTCRQVTGDHLGEEEQDVLPPFRQQVSSEHRDELGLAWLKFHEDHDRAQGLTGADLDPDEFVEEHR